MSAAKNISTTLVRYNAMCVAIAEAHAVDEVKDIRDKARALEEYARQSKNVEAEAQACEIRLRAERRAGQILKEMVKDKGAAQPKASPTPSPVASSSPKRLSDLGISHSQSSRWQKMADIPEEDFEATFAQSGQKQSTKGMIAAHEGRSAPSKPKNVVDDNALWLWGRLLDFEREGLLDSDPTRILDTMLDHMKETTRELAPKVAKWLGRIGR